MKYMVMEVHTGYAVVMDEDGRFLKAADRHYEVGQLVTEITPMAAPRKKMQPWIYSLAAVAACLALLFTMLLPAAPYASVYVKINPEVRIDVDKYDRVVGLEGINADGIALIEGYDYHRKDLNLVADELVDLAIASGYLTADGRITLTLDSTDELWVTDHSQALSNHMHEHLQNRFTITVEVSLHHGDHHEVIATVPPQTEAPTFPQSAPVCDDWDDDDDDDDWDDDDDDDWDDDDDDDDHHHGRHHDDD